MLSKDATLYYSSSSSSSSSFSSSSQLPDAQFSIQYINKSEPCEPIYCSDLAAFQDATASSNLVRYEHVHGSLNLPPAPSTITENRESGGGPMLSQSLRVGSAKKAVGVYENDGLDPAGTIIKSFVSMKMTAEGPSELSPPSPGTKGKLRFLVF